MVIIPPPPLSFPQSGGGGGGEGGVSERGLGGKIVETEKFLTLPPPPHPPARDTPLEVIALAYESFHCIYIPIRR